MTEISENDLASLFSKSADVIKEYVLSHPELLYKGVPLIAICWMTYPLLMLAWGWLPWMWASYEIYRRLPIGTLTWAYDTLRNSENIIEYLQSLGKTG